MIIFIYAQILTLIFFLMIFFNEILTLILSLKRPPIMI